MPSPFLLTIVGRLVRGFEDSEKGLRCVYWPGIDIKDREEWTLYPRTNVLQLWQPNSGKRREDIPNFKSMHEGFPHKNSYFMEYAMAGKDAIKRYLGNNMFLEFYADCLESGRLVTERNPFGKLIEKTRLGNLLPDQLRFRY